MTGKQLRTSILQEAIAGRLVPQDPTDEPASELLKRIAPRATPIQDDVPYEIPDNWEWCRMGDIISLLSGRDLEPGQYNSEGKGIPYMTGASNFAEGNLIVNRWTQKPATISKLGDLLITCKGTIGAMAFNNLGDMHIARQIMAIRSISVNLGYIREFLEFNVGLLEAQAVSMIPGISRNTLLKALIPLPPLAEQKRIVAKIEELMPLVDEYEKAQEEFDKLNAGVKGKLRASLLQEAIAGRLVPQDPRDEPASELLRRINPKATPIQDDVPFEIPNSWEWCRLKDICVFLSRGKSPKYSEEKKYPVFAQKCNLKDGWISLDNARFLDPATIGKWHDKYKLRTGDVLVNSTGTGTVCRTRRFDEKCLGPYPFVVPDSHVSVVRTHKDVSSYFILHYMSSQRTQQYLEDNLAGSTNQKELYIGVLENLPIPLPPLAEQKRIVEKLEAMFAVLDKLA